MWYSTLDASVQVLRLGGQFCLKGGSAIPMAAGSISRTRLANTEQTVGVCVSPPVNALLLYAVVSQDAHVCGRNLLNLSSLHPHLQAPRSRHPHHLRHHPAARRLHPSTSLRGLGPVDLLAAGADLDDVVRVDLVQFVF